MKPVYVRLSRKALRHALGSEVELRKLTIGRQFCSHNQRDPP
jgi:hypothetical protein